jgi:hypothetical protein
LTLKDAVATDRLDEFAAQEEARGVGPADEKLFQKIIKAAVTPKKSGIM